jgi:hypothetical protein
MLQWNLPQEPYLSWQAPRSCQPPNLPLWLPKRTNVPSILTWLMLPHWLYLGRHRSPTHKEQM